MAYQKLKLTKRAVEAIEPESKDLLVWDADLPGFGLRVTPKGRRSYIVAYRTNTGQQRRPTLGQHGVLTTDEARAEARRMLRAVSLGGDPVGEEKAAKGGITMAGFSKEFLEKHAFVKKKARSADGDRRNLENHVLPRLGSKPVISIERKDIAKLHHDMRETPGAANRVVALLSKMFNLAEQWGYRPDNSNPCRHIEKYKERKIERYLTGEELGRLGAALRSAETENDFAPSALAAIRLLMFTGCRKEEILSLEWRFVDLESRCLRLPDSKTGAKVVYLNEAALAVLESVERQADNPYIIVGNKPGTRLVSLKRPWEHIRNAADISDVRIHDLRHCFASIGAASGLGLPIVGALLGHKDTSTTQRYAHLDANPLRDANELIGQKLCNLIEKTNIPI